MKDKLNTDLGIGDIVVYTRGTKSELYIGTVRRFTPTKVMIIPDSKESWKEEVPMRPNNLLIISEIVTLKMLKE